MTTAMKSLLLGALMVASAVGCTRTSAPKPALAVPQTSHTLTAGGAIVDVTPAPGLGLHGHGPAGRVSKGTLLRLRCQPLVLAQGSEVLALVPCDLAWPSIMVQRRVAKRVQELLKSDWVANQPPIGAEDIAIFATHTHGAPSHQFASSNYSGILSAPDPGYSDDVTDFLAGEIAAGIAKAYTNRRPARIGWSTGELHGISQNRSLDAFGNNLLTPDEAKLYAGDPREPLARRVIDPLVSVLRVDDATCAAAPVAPTPGQPLPRNNCPPIGGFAVFGVHGTAVASTNELYEGDVFGYATRAFTSQCRARLGVAGPTTPRPPGVVVGDGCELGIANGLSGDVGPAADYQGPREARRLGLVLGEKVADLFHTTQTSAGPNQLKVTYSEIDVPEAASVPDPELFRDVDEVAPWPAQRTCLDTRKACKYGAIGIAASGGVEENQTFFHPLGDMFREGSPLAADPDAAGCHAPKRELAIAFQGNALPSVAPIHVAVVGDTLLTTFPAEMTVTAGLRAKRRLELWMKARSGPTASPNRVVQVTHATEYFQYVATEDEYAMQNYEGASTLYGPATLRLFANEQLCLASKLLDGKPCKGDPPRVPDQLRDLSWSTTIASRSPFVTPFQHQVTFTTPSRATRDGEEGLHVELREINGVPEVDRGIRVRVVDASNGHQIDDDEGDGLAVRLVEEDIPGGCSDQATHRGGCPYWSISWYPNHAVRALAAGRKVRFFVWSAAQPKAILCGIKAAGCRSAAAGAP
jgi:neutral ceramidase